MSLWDQSCESAYLSRSFRISLSLPSTLDNSRDNLFQIFRQCQAIYILQQCIRGRSKQVRLELI